MLQTLQNKPQNPAANGCTIFNSATEENTSAKQPKQSKPPKENRRLKAYQRRADGKGIALTLAQEIKLIQEKPEFAPFKLELEIVIRKIRKKGEQSPEKNKTAVLKALRSGAATIAEIAEDTSLEKNDIASILEEFEKLNKIEIKVKWQHPNTPRSYQTKLYFLRDNG